MLLVDTNILGELTRTAPNHGVLAWAAEATEVAVSAITVEEVAYGLAWRPNERIERWFETFFADRCAVLPVTAEIASEAGRLRGTLRTGGATRTQADMLIAATALVHRLTLVTRNTRDFTGCAIALLDPFR